MFRRADDMRYVRFLRNLHREVLFDWYMEIGCRNGRTFAPARGKTVAVDPFFRIDSNVIGAKPQLHVLQQTSDAFFADGFLSRLGITLSFSFLDGMHLFEYLLRDFANTEARSDPKGVIALHDCCPFSYGMTTRDLNNLPSDAWTGDVWKLIPILLAYRPDLTITVLGCRPTGLVLVSGLDPESGKLMAEYDSILRNWSDVTLEDYGAERFYDGFAYTPAAGLQAGGFRIFDGVRLPEANQAEPAWVSP